MKKSLMVFLIICALFITSGCVKRETLNCFRSNDNLNIETNIIYADKKADTMSLMYSIDLSKYTDEQIEVISTKDYCNTINEALPQYNGAFINCKQDIKNKKLYVSTGVDINKLSGGPLKSVSTIESAQKDLESSGYTCRVK